MSGLLSCRLGFLGWKELSLLGSHLCTRPAGSGLEQSPWFKFFKTPFGHRQPSMLLVISCPCQHLPPLLSLIQPDWTPVLCHLPSTPSHLSSLCLQTSPCPSVRRLVRDSTSSGKRSLMLLSRPRPGQALTLRLPSQACLLPPSCFQTRHPHSIRPTRTVTPDSKACAHLLSLCPA